MQGNEPHRLSASINTPILLKMLAVFALVISTGNASDILFSDGFEDISSTNHPPKIISSPSLVVEEGVMYQYDVNATDIEGDAISYSLAISPEGMSMDAATGLIMWLPADTDIGNHPIHLTATDDHDGYAVQDYTLTVVPAIRNLPPVANAGDDQTLTLGDTSYLDGSTSQDPDGTIEDFWWQQVNGAPIVLEQQSAATPRFTAQTEGIYEFELGVRDNLGATATDRVRITILPVSGNQFPVANAGKDREAVETVEVELDGYASQPGQGHRFPRDGFNWKQVSGPPVILRFRDYRKVISFTAPEVISNTVLSFELSIVNSDGETDTDIVNVLVKDESSNLPPVADAGNDRIYPNPVWTIPLSGASSHDSDGIIASYKWIVVRPDGRVSTTQASPDPYGFLYGNQVGDYTITLEVTDNNGATTTDVVHVTVRPAPGNGNQLPNAKATLDGHFLDGTRSQDPDGSITNFHWHQTRGKPLILPKPNSNRTEIQWERKVPGNRILRHSIVLLVEDNQGAVDSISLSFTRWLNAGTIWKPVPYLQLPLLALAGEPLVLDGSLSTDKDTEGYLDYEWSQISGPSIDFQGQNSAIINTLAPDISGLSHTSIKLKVTDVTDIYSTVNKILTIISRDHQSTLIDAGEDQWVLPGSAVTLSGAPLTNANYMPKWIQLSGPRVEITNNHDWNMVFTAPQTDQATEMVFALARIQSDFSGGFVRSADLVKITVTLAPVAVAGDDLQEMENEQILLDGSASSGEALQYLWEQVSGSDVVLENPDTAIASFIAPATAVNVLREFRLTVTDVRGNMAKDSIFVTVTPDLNDGDRDADGVADENDAFPDDPNDAYDYDGDGVGDNADLDRDGDGVVNNSDFYPDDPIRSIAPVLTITQPASGSKIADDSILVTGTLSAPWNTGVLINGRLALRGGSPWGSSFALRLPLRDGNNNIEVTVTGQSDNQISQALNVTRNGNAAFHLGAAPLRAFAPAEILLIPDIPPGLNIVRAEWDFDDGTSGLVLSTAFNAPVAHTYAAEGLYYPSLTLTGADNLVYTQRLAIAAIGRNALESRLKSLWDGMLASLDSSNFGLSRTFLLNHESGGYGDVFYLLLPYMSTIVPGFSAPEAVEVGISHAEYAIGEMIDGTERVFLIQLLCNAWGVWKVEGM